MTDQPQAGTQGVPTEISTDIRKICRLNDNFRKRSSDENIYTSLGVAKLGSRAIEEIINQIRSTNDFEVDNSRLGQHNFGSVSTGNNIVYWRIDYYDKDEEDVSPDPSDASVTTRVMTISFSTE